MEHFKNLSTPSMATGQSIKDGLVSKEKSGEKESSKTPRGSVVWMSNAEQATGNAEMKSPAQQGVGFIFNSPGDSYTSLFLSDVN